MRVCSLLLCCLAGYSIAASPVKAQEWGVKRDPFDVQVVNRYKAILGKNPFDDDALAKLTNLYKKHRTLEKLLAEYQNSPKQWESLVIIARIYESQGKWEEAQKAFGDAEAQKHDPNTAFALAKILRSQGKFSDALPVFEKLADDPKLSAAKKNEVFRVVFDLALGENDLERAGKFYARARAAAPTDSQLDFDWAEALAKAQRIKDALAILQTRLSATTKNPEKLPIILRIGSIYEAGGDNEAASKQYRQALQMAQGYAQNEVIEKLIEAERKRRALPQLVTELETMWPTAKRNHDQWAALGELFDETGQPDKAISALRSAIAKAPYELETSKKLIVLLERSGRDSEINKEYERLLRIAPGEPKFQLEYAQRIRKEGNQNKALSMLSKIRARFGNDVGVQAALADLYTEWGKDELALEAFRKLTTIDPGDAEHWVKLGEVFFQKNDRKKAVAIWQTIANDKKPDSQARLANVYSDHDMLTESLEIYTKLLASKDAKSVKPDWWRARASVLDRLRRPQEAISDLETYLQTLPNDASNKGNRRDARRLLISLARRAGVRIAADLTKKWEKAAQKVPPDPDAVYLLIELDIKSGNRDKAQTRLLSLLKATPDDVDAMEQLVGLYVAQRKYDQALTWLATLIEKAPAREREFLAKMSEIQTHLRHDREAMEYAEKALEKSPNDPAMHVAVAQRLEEMQEFSRAVDMYEKAKRLDPSNTAIYQRLGRLYQMQEEPQRAAKTYRELLAATKDEDVLLKAGREAISLEELMGTLGDLESVIRPLSFRYTKKAAYRQLLLELYERYVPWLVTSVEKSSGATQAAHKRELADLRDRSLVVLLSVLADEEMPAQRRVAISLLGALGNPSASAPLLRLAQQRATGALAFESWELRMEALINAARIAQPKHVPDLLAFAQDPEVAMREAAVYGLGLVDDGRAAEGIRRALSDARSSVQTLACFSADNHFAILKASVLEMSRKVELSETTRAACILTLAKHGVGQIQDYISVLEKAQPLSAQAAAWALANIGNNQVRSKLYATYFAAPTWLKPAVRKALSQLSAGQKPAAFTPHFSILHGKYDELGSVSQLFERTESAALRAEDIIGMEAAIVEGLRQALANPDLVNETLALLGGDQTARAQQTAEDVWGLWQASASVQANAARHSVETAITPVIAALAEGSKSSAAKIEMSALAVLANFANQTSADIFARALTSPQKPRLQAALTYLPTLLKKNPAMTKVVIVPTQKLVRHSDWQIRRLVALAWPELRLGTNQALTQLARDKSAMVRWAAIGSVARLPASETRAVLLRERSLVKNESSGPIRRTAVRGLALQGVAGKDFVQSIAQHDPDPSVRRAAEQTIKLLRK